MVTVVSSCRALAPRLVGCVRVSEGANAAVCGGPHHLFARRAGVCSHPPPSVHSLPSHHTLCSQCTAHARPCVRALASACLNCYSYTQLAFHGAHVVPKCKTRSGRGRVRRLGHLFAGRCQTLMIPCPCVFPRVSTDSRPAPTLCGSVAPVAEFVEGFFVVGISWPPESPVGRAGAVESGCVRSRVCYWRSMRLPSSCGWVALSPNAWIRGRRMLDVDAGRGFCWGCGSTTRQCSGQPEGCVE